MSDHVDAGCPYLKRLNAMGHERDRAQRERDELLAALRRRVLHCTVCTRQEPCFRCVEDSALIARIEGGK